RDERAGVLVDGATASDDDATCGGRGEHDVTGGVADFELGTGDAATGLDCACEPQDAGVGLEPGGGVAGVVPHADPVSGRDRDVGGGAGVACPPHADTVGLEGELGAGGEFVDDVHSRGGHGTGRDDVRGDDLLGGDEELGDDHRPDV